MKKNIVIVLLSILTILMGGTSLYLYTNKDKIFEKYPVEEIKETNENEKEIIQNSFEINNKTKIQALNGDNYRIYISKEGEAYLTVFPDYTSSTLSAENNEHLEKLQKRYKPYYIEGFCNTDGDLRNEICENDDYVNSIRINTKNVIAAYDTINGQDVDSNKIIFLKSDGTIDALNIGSIIWNKRYPIVQRNVGKLKNIVTIAQSESVGVPSGSKYAIAIENNGTQHVLSEYLDY